MIVITSKNVLFYAAQTTVKTLKQFKIIVVFILLVAFQQGFAQSPLLSVDTWADKLSDKDYKQKQSYITLDSILLLTDSSTTFQFLQTLEDNGKSRGLHFQARFNCLKASQLYNKNFKFISTAVKEEIKRLFSTAINIAYETEDDYLVAFVSSRYGGLIYFLGELELAVMYSINGVEMNEKLSLIKDPVQYQSTADLLYKIREYRLSLAYSHKSLNIRKQLSIPNDSYSLMNCLNTTALNYHRLGIFDSAFLHYQMALNLAVEINNIVWQGIISGNMGQVYYMQQKYDSAKLLLYKDYLSSKEAGYYDNAANSFQWAARAELSTGNTSKALTMVREALYMLKLVPDIQYLQNTYYTATQVFKELGMYDSAYYYHLVYSNQKDSIDKLIHTSSIAISKARLSDEKNRYGIKNLQQEKRAQLLQRNILIAAILLLSLITLIIINRQRLKAQLKVELMQKEISSAKEQLQMFTQNIIEKTTLIEKLEEQAKRKTSSEDQEMMIAELSQQTILTEDDWLHFKSLFEKTYPGFLTKLKEKAADITLAEQRMAALSRLQLTTSQMAAMLGISADSVRKSRLRLKQRLGLSAETNLDDIIHQL